jgi:hypothetical protein
MGPEILFGQPLSEIPPQPPFGKGGNERIFLESLAQKSPAAPPLIKGGQKSLPVNSCNNAWNAFEPNETGTETSLVRNFFALDGFTFCEFINAG